MYPCRCNVISATEESLSVQDIKIRQDEIAPLGFSPFSILNSQFSILNSVSLQ